MTDSRQSLEDGERGREPSISTPASAEPIPLITGLCHFLAHDLGNAVSALTITLDLLGREDLPDRPRQLLQRVGGLQGRLQGMVDALGTLGGARPRRGRLELRTRLEAVFKALKLRERFQAELDLSELEDPTTGSMIGDANLLELCLRLLLRNAAEATPAGGRLGVRARSAGGQTRLVIWDEGEGVPREHRHKLFKQPFSSKAGNGVGLLLVRAAVEGAFGGRVSFEPNSPRGSCFNIELPP